MLNSVTLLGSSSGKNAGDAALIAGIIESTDSACGKNLRWEIPTIKPSYIRNNYRGDVHPVSMLPWSLSLKMLGLPTVKSMLKTDLSLVFDAILFDRSLWNPLFNYLSTIDILLPMAARKGRLTGYFNCGVGPITTTRGKEMLRRLTDTIDFVTVRDEDSRAILHDIGVTNPRIAITADAAIPMAPANEERVRQILQSCNVPSDVELLGLNVSRYLASWSGTKAAALSKTEFMTAYVAGVKRFLSVNNVPVVLVCTQVDDVSLSKEIAAALTGPGVSVSVVDNTRLNHHDIKGVLKAMALLCGMRLHATILASSELTPVLGLPHQPKVQHYFKSLGISERILSFADFSPASFAALLTRGWEERAAQRAHLARVIPAARERAMIPARIIAELHHGKSLDAAWSAAVY